MSWRPQVEMVGQVEVGQVEVAQEVVAGGGGWGRCGTSL